jgi:hypothetical protein
MRDDGDCRANGGMKIGRGKYSEKTYPAPLCPPQIPYQQTRTRTRAAAAMYMRLRNATLIFEYHHNKQQHGSSMVCSGFKMVYSGFKI